MTTPSLTNWHQDATGLLNSISISGDLACGIINKAVYCSEEPDVWHIVNGNLDNIALNGTAACGTFNSALFCTDNILKPDLVWDTLDTPLTSVSMTQNSICGINSQHLVLCSDSNAAYFRKIEPTLKQISISGKKACGITLDNSITCSDDFKKGKWTDSTMKNVDQIEITETTKCIVKDDQLYCTSWDSDEYTCLDKKVTTIGVCEDKIAATTKETTVFHGSIN